MHRFSSQHVDIDLTIMVNSWDQVQVVDIGLVQHEMLLMGGAFIRILFLVHQLPRGNTLQLVHTVLQYAQLLLNHNKYVLIT